MYRMTTVTLTHAPRVNKSPALHFTTIIAFLYTEICEGLQHAELKVTGANIIDHSTIQLCILELNYVQVVVINSEL